MARVTFNGEPGTAFVNDTGRVLYQFICNFHNSCGLCIQYAHAVGPSWPIPMHPRCRCRQSLVAPGHSAEPFLDFRAEIAALDPHQQARVVGASNLRLIETGVVEWSDVVTATRVRDLREVVALKKLSVERMTAAGVPKYQARTAHETVHTPAHELAERRRGELLANLKAKGLSEAEVRRAVAERLAARAGIGAGPSGPQAAPVVPTTPKPKPAIHAEAPILVERFGPSRATVVVRPSLATKGVSERDFLDHAEKIFGHKVTIEQLASVAGAPDDATVHLNGIANKMLGIAFRGPNGNYKATRIIKKTSKGIVVKNESFRVATTGGGVGGAVFGRQIEQAARLGVDRLETLAAGSHGDPHYNGYSTWAKFGYDGPIPNLALAKAATTAPFPPGLEHATKVSDLMTTKEGREWWTLHGSSFEGTFSLKPGSKSLQRWNAYLEAKDAQKAGPSSPTSTTTKSP